MFPWGVFSPSETPFPPLPEDYRGPAAVCCGFHPLLQRSLQEAAAFSRANELRFKITFTLKSYCNLAGWPYFMIMKATACLCVRRRHQGASFTDERCHADAREGASLPARHPGLHPHVASGKLRGNMNPRLINSLVSLSCGPSKPLEIQSKKPKPANQPPTKGVLIY